MSNEVLDFVRQQLPQFLNPIRRVIAPSLYYCETELKEPLAAGEIRFAPAGEIDVPKPAVEVITARLRELNIDVSLPQFTDDNAHMDLRLKLRPKTERVLSCKFAAPWYVDLYCQSPETPQEIVELLRIASIANETRLFIFRGEPELYGSVRSTLARHWNTDSPEALRILVESSLQAARQYLPNEQHEDLGLSAVIQHMGGKTNLVDFTTEVWVALFFACLDDREPPKKGNTGRVYALDWIKAEHELEVHSLEHQTSQIQRNRWEQQSGVVIIPQTGTVPSTSLTEIARIPSEHKEAVNRFLDNIGVSTKTMFNDIEGYIRYEQDYVPMAALCHIAVRHIGNGEYIPAFAIAESLIQRDRAIDQDTGYYFRGLCHATQGRLRQAERDINEFIRIRNNRRIPDYVHQNLRVVQRALTRNRNADYDAEAGRRIKNLREQLCLEIDESLWSVSFPGYVIRG